MTDQPTSWRIDYRHIGPAGSSDVIGVLVRDNKPVVEHISSSLTWLRLDLWNDALRAGVSDVPDRLADVNAVDLAPAPPQRPWIPSPGLVPGVLGCPVCGCLVFDPNLHETRCQP